MYNNYALVTREVDSKQSHNALNQNSTIKFARFF